MSWCQGHGCPPPSSAHQCLPAATPLVPSPHTCPPGGRVPTPTSQPVTWRHQSLSESCKNSLCPSPAASPGVVSPPCPNSYPGGYRSILMGPYAIVSCSCPSPQTPYLSEGALEGPKFIEAPGGNADHGGQSQEPAQGITPPRVRVLFVVGQRSVLDQREEEGGLRRRGEEKGAGRAGALCSPHPLEELAEILHSASLDWPPGSSGSIKPKPPTTLYSKFTPSQQNIQGASPLPAGPCAPVHLYQSWPSVRKWS